MELLVVITILLMVAVVALPVMAPSKEGRRVREAARSLNTFFGAARAQAMETGRPVGVWIERMAGMPDAAMTVYQAESPPTYSGDFGDATMRVRATFPTNLAAGVEEIPMSLEAQPVIANSVIPSRIRVGDLIRFSYKDPPYEITGPADAYGNIVKFPLTLRGWAPLACPPQSSSSAFPVPASPWINLLWPQAAEWSPPVPFEIIRQPVRSTAPPLEMPVGAVIDLAFSGSDLRDLLTDVRTRMDRTWFGSKADNDTSPVIIMFSPSGTIDRVYCSHVNRDSNGRATSWWWGMVQNSDRLYLMVGQRERVPASFASASPDFTNEIVPSNLGTSTNLWVTLNALTGMIGASEVYQCIQNPQNNRHSWYLWKSREYARTTDDMLGGR